MSPTRTPKGAAGLRAEDVKPHEQTKGPKTAVGGLANWMDERTGTAKPISYALKKVFPDHWSFMLGEIAMFSLIILLVTGTFLTFWFVPSAGQVIYNGSYVPLKGIAMSEAFKSTVDISFDVRGGLIMRQIHHWAALMFTVSITVHMFRVFFTGAFRKPREVNWVIGTILSLLAINEGFTGYSLPDDLLSGTGLRAARASYSPSRSWARTSPTPCSTARSPVRRSSPASSPCTCSCCPPSCRAVYRPYRARGSAQAHPVPRPGQDERQTWSGTRSCRSTWQSPGASSSSSLASPR